MLKTVKLIGLALVILSFLLLLAFFGTLGQGSETLMSVPEPPALLYMYLLRRGGVGPQSLDVLDFPLPLSQRMFQYHFP